MVLYLGEKMKFDNNKYGVVVRAIGERTENLCIEAIRKYTEPFIIKNVHPHLRANLTMYEIMLNNPRKWWLSVDADVVLKKDWASKMEELVKDCEDILSSIPKEYEFILDKIHNRGCRTYNGKLIKYCYNNVKLNYDKVVNNLFPEDAARRLMNSKFNNTTVKKHVVIGWHGCEQYYTHIYNAYIRYAIRTKGDKNERNLTRNWKPKNINNKHNSGRKYPIMMYQQIGLKVDLLKRKDCLKQTVFLIKGLYRVL